MSLLTCLITYNRLELTKRTLESYLDTVPDEHALVVVDNASTDGTREWLQSQPGINLLMLSDVNMYPGKACNEGWAAALQHTDPTFLHRSDNDQLYHPGWWDEAERCFDAITGLGQVGLCNMQASGRPVSEYTEGGVTVNVAWENTAGTCVIRRELWDEGLRFKEGPWHIDPEAQRNGQPTATEDAWFSLDVMRMGRRFVHLIPPVVEDMSAGNFDQYPDYYRTTLAQRGYPEDARV